MREFVARVVSSRYLYKSILGAERRRLAGEKGEKVGIVMEDEN